LEESLPQWHHYSGEGSGGIIRQVVKVPLERSTLVWVSPFSCLFTVFLSSLFPVFSFPPLLLMLNSATLPSYSPYPLNSPLRQKLTNSILRCNVPSNSILTILRGPHASLVIRRWYLCRESLAPSHPFLLLSLYHIYREGPQHPS
jgi:hypothetical protein